MSEYSPEVLTLISVAAVVWVAGVVLLVLL